VIMTQLQEIGRRSGTHRGLVCELSRLPRLRLPGAILDKGAGPLVRIGLPALAETAFEWNLNKLVHPVI
jgi:hypothetical protein